MFVYIQKIRKLKIIRNHLIVAFQKIVAMFVIENGQILYFIVLVNKDITFQVQNIIEQVLLQVSIIQKQ